MLFPLIFRNGQGRKFCHTRKWWREKKQRYFHVSLLRDSAVSCVWNYVQTVNQRGNKNNNFHWITQLTFIAFPLIYNSHNEEKKWRKCCIHIANHSKTSVLWNVGFLRLDPRKWKKAQVVAWINEVCEMYEIEEAHVSKLKTLSGDGLNQLERQDWKERSPNQGDLFYNLWVKLMKNSEKDDACDTAKSPPSSPRNGKQNVSSNLTLTLFWLSI